MHKLIRNNCCSSVSDVIVPLIDLHVVDVHVVPAAIATTDGTGAIDHIPDLDPHVIVTFDARRTFPVLPQPPPSDRFSHLKRRMLASRPATVVFQLLQRRLYPRFGLLKPKLLLMETVRLLRGHSSSTPLLIRIPLRKFSKWRCKKYKLHLLYHLFIV